MENGLPEYQVKAEKLLSGARVEVSPETYAVISLTHTNWTSLLDNPELSPRMTAPFLIFKDRWEVTMVLDEEDYLTVRHAVRDAGVEKGFRLLSFDVDLGFDVIGFMARISAILADAGISILPVSSFSRDHVLVKQGDLAKALRALRGHIAEVC
ncbi:MAG: ACT domain-containing protein [Acidobacteriota bacterium]|nr:ACT domain-containing protein [Acidobacteriota bacterium]